MDVSFFNYQYSFAETAWERRDWLNRWLRIDRKDPYWTPPPHSLLKSALTPSRNKHLARLAPVFLSATAMVRSKSSFSAVGQPGFDQRSPYASDPTGATVGAVLHLVDPRRKDGAAYFGLLKSANHQETLERLLDKLIANLPGQEVQKWVGPTWLSPHLGSGLLVDGWDQPPPLYAPYNPPYLPEIIAGVMEPLAVSRLLTYDISSPGQTSIDSQTIPAGLRLRPLALPELSSDLLALLQAACQNSLGFPVPDAIEAEFLVLWLSYWPFFGWVAELEGEPVGFVLLQPDFSPLLRKTGGGRGLVGRARLSWGRQNAHPAQGKLVLGGVLPGLRSRGIGTQLWKQAVQFGHTQGWNSISIGPLEESSEAFAFLQRRGAVPCQTYQIYQYELS